MLRYFKTSSFLQAVYFQPNVKSNEMKQPDAGSFVYPASAVRPIVKSYRSVLSSKDSIDADKFIDRPLEAIEKAPAPYW